MIKVQERVSRSALTSALVIGAVLGAVVIACGGDDATTSSTTNGADASVPTPTPTPPPASGDAAPTCASTETLCGSSCVDTKTNRENCGTCGKACGADEVCAAGACALACPSNLTKCTGGDAGATCVDTKTDPANCGACGTTCAAGQVCSPGADGGPSACALVCSGGTTKCGSKCADTKTDDANCGACGTVCGAGTACTNGGCCAAGQTSCSNACVDTARSTTNCGACGTACANNQVCTAGSCTAPFASCKAILTAKPAAKSGVYTIAINGTNADVYCDMTTDGGGWTMAMKVSRGAGGDAYDLWNGAALNDADATLLDYKRAANHYVSRIPTEWNTNFAVTEARVQMVDNGTTSAFLRFEGLGASTKIDFFSFANLSKNGPATSWTDINDLVTNNQAFTGNFFSIAGETTAPRRWYVNHNYGGCSADNGWFVADSPADPCAWEFAGPPPRLLYSKLTTSATFESGLQNGNIQSADVLVVLVR